MNNLHRLVSSEGEELILVDDQDNEIGFRSKADCHDGDGVLHRAFSLFLFNDEGHLLLQQRSEQKRLWPGYWSNSCCSHPRRGESLSIATMRRLDDELNVAADLESIYHFTYQANFGEAGSENELCHVFLGNLGGSVRPNDNEIESIRYVLADELDGELAESPGRFTPWFKQEWRTLREEAGVEAMVNWNQRHWTVLKYDMVSRTWLHINSCLGPARRHGLSEGLRAEDVEQILAEIRRSAGGASLHRAFFLVLGWLDGQTEIDRRETKPNTIYTGGNISYSF